MLGLLGSRLHSHLVARILAWALSTEQQFWMWSVVFRVTQSPHHQLTASHRERSGRHVRKKHHEMMTMHLWHNDLHVTEKGLNLYQIVIALHFTLCSSVLLFSCMYVCDSKQYHHYDQSINESRILLTCISLGQLSHNWLWQCKMIDTNISLSNYL